MKKVLALTLLLMLSLAACNDNNNNADSNTNAPPTTALELATPSEPPIRSKPAAPSETTVTSISEKVSVSVDYAPDEISGEYDFFEDEYGDYETERIMFRTNTAVKDFSFIEIGFIEKDTDLKYYKSRSSLYSMNEFLPEKPLVVTWLEQGLMPHRGISFVDENDKTRYFYLSKSGEDNSLLLIEFEYYNPGIDDDFLKSIDGLAIQEVASNAAKAFLRTDVEELSQYLSHPTMAEKVQSYSNVYNNLESFAFVWTPENRISDERVNISYQYVIKGEDSNSYVTMTLDKADGIWKVDRIGTEN
jgi:hypothetical protein